MARWESEPLCGCNWLCCCVIPNDKKMNQSPLAVALWSFVVP
jgi:hypothetical protein